MSEAGKQLRKEIQSLIRRYTSESDDLTVGDIVQVLEVEKFNFLMSEERYLQAGE